MTVGKPLIPINAPVAIGFAIMSAFAATLFPVWAQAVAFDIGSFAAVMGSVRVAWHYRFWWGKSMIGSLLVFGFALILAFAAMFLGWFSIQGIKGAFRAEYQPHQTALPPTTPQSLRDAFVEAFDLIRSRQPDEPVTALLPAPPEKKRKPKKPKLLANPKEADANPPQAAIAAPVTVPALPAPNAVQPVTPAASPYQPPANRQLTIDQQKILVAALSQLSSKVEHSYINYAPNDGEVFAYANQFFKVFQLSALKPILIQETQTDPSETGLMLETGPNSSKELIATVLGELQKVGLNVKVVKRPISETKEIRLFVSSQPL